jgi:hypothetical protein
MVFFGADDGRVITYDGASWDVWSTAKTNTEKPIHDIAFMDNGAILLGTDGDGLIYMTDAGTASYTKDDGLPSNFIRSVAVDGNVIHLACYGGIGEITIPAGE